MKKIFKYSIPVKEKFTMELPRDAQIVRVDDVDGLFWMWAIVDTNPTVKLETRYFENYKTGQEIKTPVQDLKYLGMVKMFIMQELALYVFENISIFRPIIEKKIPLAGSLDALIPIEGPVQQLFDKSGVRSMTQEERDAMNRACDRSAIVIDEGIDETVSVSQPINVYKDFAKASETCPNALLPDGPVCPRCGGRRGASGVDGGSWVHF